MENHKNQTPASSSADPDRIFDVVALAASAGGLQAISVILAALPEDFRASVAVVQHLDPRHPSLLVDILSRRTALRVFQAEEGAFLQPGAVYIAPPDRHLLVIPNGSLSLTQSELVHFVRPSADLLFESLAASYKERAIAVVLTGTGSDGSLGVQAIKKMGGIVIVQNKETSEFFGMPGAAMELCAVDYVLPLREIGPVLVKLVQAERW